MTYQKNIGFQEMILFTQKATPEQQLKMDQVVAKEDWEGFRNLIKSVLKTDLE
jgi:hypothetical protein